MIKVIAFALVSYAPEGTLYIEYVDTLQECKELIYNLHERIPNIPMMGKCIIMDFTK